MALEDFFARGYVQIGIESGEIANVERRAGMDLAAHRRSSVAEGREFCRARGGEAGGEIPVRQDGSEPGGIAEMVGELP